MSKPTSGQIVSGHLLKLVLGVVSLFALAMLACNDSGNGSVSSPEAPPGMFSTLPTSEPPVLGDQPPTVELNTPEPTLTPQPTPTPNPTYTPVPTPTPASTGTPTPNPTGTPVPTQTPYPTATPQPSQTPQPTYTPVPLPASTPYPTATPQPSQTPQPTYTPVPLPASTPYPTATAVGNNGVSNTAGDGALHKAVHNCDLDTVKILIAAGANVNSRGRWPQEDMPLHKALKLNCDSAMVKFLVDSGADLNALSDWPGEYTPLQLAVWETVTADDSADRSALLNVVQVLVDLGADINAGSFSPLDIAVHHEDTALVRILTGVSN